MPRKSGGSGVRSELDWTVMTTRGMYAPAFFGRHNRSRRKAMRFIASGTSAETAVFGTGLAGHAGFEFENLRLQTGIVSSENFYGEQAGVAAIADGDGGDGDASGHLDDGKQGIEASEGFRLN